ncbi:MAG: FecR domain-containing protein [Chloroflexota bacterium]
MSTSAQDATLTASVVPAAASARPAAAAQRRTWIVIVGAFVLWCAIVASAATAGYTYRRYATDSPTLTLAIDRGTVFYEGAANPAQVRARPGMTLEEGGVVETGENGRAAVALFDGSVARLLPKARLELTTLRVGKFNPEHTRLAVHLATGAANFNVVGGLPYNREVVVTTPHGLVRLSKGDYLVWVSDDGTRVSSYSGQAKLEIEDKSVRISDGRRAALPTDGYPRGPFPLGENLIRNGDFTAELRGWTMVDRGEPGRQDVGGVRALVEDSIAGRKIQALRITRDTQKDTHNETGISQEIRRDVSAYRNLLFTAWVRINNASLSGGGYLGSEYPIMFRVSYTDEDGGKPGWSHGFFYANTQNRPTPIGEQIAQGQWFPYLGRLTDLPDRAVFIQSVEVVSAGHDFDALVADIRLMAE